MMTKKTGIAICWAAAILLGLATSATARLETHQNDINEPAKDASVNLTLAFSQRVSTEKTVVQVRDSHGALVEIGRLRIGANGTDLEIPLSAPLRPDIYTIRWRAVSMQGFVDVGGYDFTIDPLPVNPTPAVAQQ